MKKWQLLKNLSQMKANTKLSSEEIKKLQKQKLQKLLLYAYENSAYYHRTFSEAGINEDNIDEMSLCAFPTLDKRTLLARFEEIVTSPEIRQDTLREYDEQEDMNASPYLEKYHVVHSSGSTGKPGYFVYDQQAWETMLLGIIRAALWDMSMPQILNMLVKRPRVLYVAAVDGRYGGVMAVGDGITDVGAKQLHLDINAPLEEWISKVHAFNPNLIIGYPSAIKILGEIAQEQKIHLELLRIVTCGEPLGTGLRKQLEIRFHTKVYNFYGASEALALGIESDPEEGMILFDDMNICEVINGKMYLTSLYNFTQPLIRYEMTDSLLLREAFPQEKYQFTKAQGLLGRCEDILWFEDEKGKKDFLHPLSVEGFCIDGLIDYQFWQTGTNSFEMGAEIADKGNVNEILAEVEKRMQEILTDKKLNYVKFTAKQIAKILPDSKCGKKKLIIKKREDIPMKTIENKTFSQERALYGSNEILLHNCSFDGEEDGESALKESSNITVEDTFCNLRYPFWHDHVLKISGCKLTELCRAALWYSEDVEIVDSTLHGIKALRECSKVTMKYCDVISPEFGWSVRNIQMSDSIVQSEYFMMRSEDLRFNKVKLKGKYSFQYVKNAIVENCDFDTKDSFWHAENVTIKNSTIKGEYFAWYSNGLTLENCRIVGTQPLCYCQNLKLINCEMIDTDLCFEKSEVEATITTPVMSIKNPSSGTIVLPYAQEIIMDDEQAKGQIVQTKKSCCA